MKTYLCVAMLLLAIQFDDSPAHQSLDQTSEFKKFPKFSLKALKNPKNLLRAGNMGFKGGASLLSLAIPAVNMFQGGSSLFSGGQTQPHNNIQHIDATNFHPNNGGRNLNNEGQSINNGGQNFNNEGQNLANGGQINSPDQHPNQGGQQPNQAGQQPNHAGQQPNVAYLRS